MKSVPHPITVSDHDVQKAVDIIVRHSLQYTDTPEVHEAGHGYHHVHLRAFPELVTMNSASTSST